MHVGWGAVKNALNLLNSSSFLQNISYLCPSISTFVEDCYSVPSSLFILWMTEISSTEEEAQGDPVTIYGIGVTPLINKLIDIEHKVAVKFLPSHM